MKKTFVIQVEYPDGDMILSDEIIEVTQECIDTHLEKYFGANIMDGEYDRIKVKEINYSVPLIDKYVMVPYDQSEEFDDVDGCYYIFDPIPGGKDVPIIVPEKEYCKKKGLPYPFSNTCTNGELIDLLSQFPRDAVIGIEYCSPKKLQYFKGRNFIAID